MQNPDLEKQITTFFNKLEHIKKEDLEDDSVSSISEGACLSDFEESMEQLMGHSMTDNQEQI